MAEKRTAGSIFFKVPKVLFTDVVYCSISTDAKMLYALLLDRKQLSKKNGLITGFGDPFVYMTIEETCVKLNCGHEKACRLFKELECCGLIIRRSQGFGRAVRIYPVEII